MEATEKEKKNIEELLRNGENVLFPPTGTSMWPLWKQGDLVEVAPLTRAPRRLDVCVYRRDSGMLVIHRVIRVRKDGFYLAGDHQTQLEGPLRAEQFLGVLVAIHRGGKRRSVRNPFLRIGSLLWAAIRPFRWSVIRMGSRFKRLFHKK